MTSISTKKSSFIQRQFKKLRKFFMPSDFVGWLLVTALTLLIPLSFFSASWPLNMTVIIPMTFISTFFGLVFSRTEFGELLGLIVSATYGVCIALLLSALSLGGDLGTGLGQVFLRLVEWGIAVQTGGINQDDLIFTLLVAILLWFLGYNASWHTFRVDHVWRVILPVGIILGANLVFYTGDGDLTIYLVGFMFVSLILIARSYLDNQEWTWYSKGIRPPKHLRGQFLIAGALLALLTVGIGAVVPSDDIQERLDEFQEFLQSDILQELSEFWNRLFSPIEAQGPVTADYYGGDSLDLGGAIRLGNDVVFLVQAPPRLRYYWRSRVFDTYEGGKWTPARDTILTDNVPPTDLLVIPPSAREAVSQTFIMKLNSNRLIYTAPQPLSVDLATRTEFFYTAPQGDALREMSISVIRPTQVLRADSTYTATSLMSTATATQLRNAGTAYPNWVRGIYLYVSSSVTPRTIQLAQQIVVNAGATNPYDQAKAIEQYLRDNITYNESIPTPPSNQDPVDWVLFDYKEGYCNYYASAMIVMLRSLGIPARMAAGFAQGNFDATQNAYVVTERDAHTWVEVYFPTYGWIEFEPTSAQAPLTRQDDELRPNPQQEVIPFSSPTPTPTPTIAETPTPLATFTPEATSTPPSDNQNPPPPDQATPTPTYTPTPTPTPTPTVTPVIVPTEPPPTPPDQNDPLAAFLPVLGVLLCGFVALIMLLVIFTLIWWWWEWRGLGGMNPIVRAYARLERYLRLIGIRPNPQDTPEERRKKVVKIIPKADKPVSAITRLYVAERYGLKRKNPAKEVAQSEAVDQAWAEARASIIGKWLDKFRFWKRKEP
jgi:transglutaminase-like putative cysteine protease